MSSSVGAMPIVVMVPNEVMLRGVGPPVRSGLTGRQVTPRSSERLRMFEPKYTVFGAPGAISIGDTQLNRVPANRLRIPCMLLPPLSDRAHPPFCEQANTLLKSTGLMRFIIPSPPRYPFQSVLPQDRSDPLSWVPPEARLTAWPPAAIGYNREYASTWAFVQVPITLPLSSDQYSPPSLPTYTRPWLCGSQASACWSTWMPRPRIQVVPPVRDSIIGTPAENRWSASAGSTQSRPNHQANPPSAASSAGSPVSGRVQVAPPSFDTKKRVRFAVRSLVIALARLGSFVPNATPIRPGSLSGVGSGAPTRVQVCPPSVDQ